MNDDDSTADPHPATLLLGERPVCLADWYGDPLVATDAGVLQQIAEQVLQSRLCRGGPGFPVHLLLLICRYWLGADPGLHYRQLAATAVAGTEHPLLELVYGQLLISRKLHRGMAHLERGFALAARRLEAGDYLRLVRRHEALADLPLGDTPRSPQTLDSLLAEAAVIRRLRGRGARRYVIAHRDTLG